MKYGFLEIEYLNEQVQKMKSIYKISSQMGVTFRDESNDGN